MVTLTLPILYRVRGEHGMYSFNNGGREVQPKKDAFPLFARLHREKEAVARQSTLR